MEMKTFETVIFQSNRKMQHTHVRHNIYLSDQQKRKKKKNEHLLALTGRRKLDLTVLRSSCVFFSLTESKSPLLQIICELPLIQAVLQRLQEYRGARGVGTECPT